MKNFLKKSLLLIFALVLAVSLIACEGKKQRPAPSDDDGDSQGASEDAIVFSVIYDGVEMELGKPASSVLNALGEPNAKQEVFDCGEGNSRMLYQYSSFDLYTMKIDGEETIDEIELRDDAPETAAKIMIGSSEADVRKAYGTPSEASDTKLTYASGKMELTIDLTNGKVSGINLFRNTK